MISFKGFTTGLMAGAVVGGIMGAVIDPLKDKESKKIHKSAGSIMHSVGNLIDGFSDMRK